MVMLLVNHLLYLSGLLSLVFTQSTSSFCSGDLCYIRPSNSQMTWSEAQQICNVFNSTLPIVDNPDHQKSFGNALYHFLLSYDVWLGGKASYGDYHNWYWLNGRKYSVTDVQNQGSYNTSYAYLRNTTTQVMAYADAAFHRYSYICQFSDEAKCVSNTGQTAFSIENRCYVKFAENLPWFIARNNCLSNGGDLASFDNLSSLDSILDYNAYWVGLTSSWWNWYKSVTDQSRNFSFTLWNSQEPNDETPNCISTDFLNFQTWRDLPCNVNQFFICQIVNTSAFPETTYSHSTSLSTTSSSVVTAPAATSQISSTIGKSMPDSENSTIPLAVGLGVGIAVFVIVVIVVAVLVIRSYRKSSAAKIQALKMAVKTDEVIPYESLKYQPRGNGTDNLTIKTSLHLSWKDVQT